MNLQVTQTKLIIATAVYLVASANITFFGKVLDTYPVSGANLGFLFTLPIVLWGFWSYCFHCCVIVAPAARY